MFDFDKKKMYAQFSGGRIRPNDVPKTEASGKGINEKQNGCKILEMYWKMVNTFKSGHYRSRS